MSGSKESFLVGLISGILVTTISMLIFTVDPLKKEAIKRGFAEMKLKTPYSTEAVFTWRENAK